MITNSANKKYDFALTDNAVQWMYKTVKPVIAKDFIGWIFMADAKKKVSMSVSITGQIKFFSADVKRPVVPIRTFKKIVRKMEKHHFLRLANNDPYPETETYNNLHIDETKANFLNGYIWDTPEITYDDDPDLDITPLIKNKIRVGEPGEKVNE